MPGNAASGADRDASPKKHTGTLGTSCTDSPRCAQAESFSCSLLLQSFSSELDSLSRIASVHFSPTVDSFEESMTHRRDQSVVVHSDAEQSYGDILEASVTGSPSGAFFPVQPPPRSVYAQRLERCSKQVEVSGDVLSDCSSILESEAHATLRTIPDCSSVEPNPQVLTEGEAEVADERVSTIYTNLSSDSSRWAPTAEGDRTEIMATPPAKQTIARFSSASSSARTTNPTESNHFEIDLFDSPQFQFERSVRTSDLSETQLGALPARAFCPTCQTDVSTRVSFQLPRLPL